MRVFSILLAATLLFGADTRNITEGLEIPSEGYSDQPYIVKLDDGAWLCVITTGSGREGDGGRSWSAKRYDIPLRAFEIDRKNPYGGKLKYFWNVGKAFILKNAGYVPLHKVGGFGEGFFTSSEGVLLRSDNILTERNPDKIRWETLPDGDRGIR